MVYVAVRNAWDNSDKLYDLKNRIEELEENLKEEGSQPYSLLYKDNDIQIWEKKLEEVGEYGLYDLDMSNVDRVKCTGIDINDNFDCEWKQLDVELNNKHSCSILSERDNLNYQIVREGIDKFSSNYQIYIDNELKTEKSLQKVIGFPIQSVKWINDYFVIDYQMDLEIIPANEQTKAIQTAGYYSSIWVDGSDILDGTEYIEAFSPNGVNDELTYFVISKDGIIFQYGENVIDLLYEKIPHYGCCEESQFNVASEESVVDFFGMKGDGWYHVQIIGRSSSLWEEL